MNENHLEQACLGWLESLEFTSLKGEVVSPGGTEGGREKYSEVVLQNRLRDAIERLNPGISTAEADAAVSRLVLYSAQSMVDGNREVYGWIRDGVPVERIESDGTRTFPRVQVIDFAGPNDLLAVQQFTVHGQQVRRPDIVLFVNGLPLVVVELENPADPNADIQSAFNQIQTYKNRHPAAVLLQPAQHHFRWRRGPLWLADGRFQPLLALATARR
ncbi:type I restriction endonuclease [Pseudomonas aeruginosa]|uniref:type I restriction endonuclease n=1 Tax=Pseudomonas aeruginosa TaxID=287 RepID=UPI003749D209